ncbi:MAG TPA: hypothetical protein VLK27_10640, partial [Chthoniobacterales bacterium]|nr:hypothetical protein [Chthoniobacterales bacterium]
HHRIVWKRRADLDEWMIEREIVRDCLLVAVRHQQIAALLNVNGLLANSSDKPVTGSFPMKDLAAIKRHG